MTTEARYETPSVSVRLSDLFGIQPDPSAHITDVELQAAEHELGVRLPPSYREFLRAFGARVWLHSGLLGLPRDGLRRDLVLRNKGDQNSFLPQLVKFMEEDHGPPFYFAISLVRPNGECPVVCWDSEKGLCVVADSFLQFLERLGAERICCSPDGAGDAVNPRGYHVSKCDSLAR